MLVIEDLDEATVERAGALVAREHAAARQATGMPAASAVPGSARRTAAPTRQRPSRPGRDRRRPHGGGHDRDRAAAGAYITPGFRLPAGTGTGPASRPGGPMTPAAHPLRSPQWYAQPRAGMLFAESLLDWRTRRAVAARGRR